MTWNLGLEFCVLFLGVPLSKLRVALSPPSPPPDYRLAGFPVQSLTRNAGSSVEKDSDFIKSTLLRVRQCGELAPYQGKGISSSLDITRSWLRKQSPCIGRPCIQVDPSLFRHARRRIRACGKQISQGFPAAELAQQRQPNDPMPNIRRKEQLSTAFNHTPVVVLE